MNELKEFEIWIGRYDFGQGYDPSTRPQMLAKEKAIDFKTACFKYELRNRLEFIERQEADGKYIAGQDYEWFYQPTRNANSWTGPYFQSEEEAWRSFPRG